MEKRQAAPSGPLVRWMGNWVTGEEREAQKATQPRLEVPYAPPEPEIIEVRPHGNPWYRASLMM